MCGISGFFDKKASLNEDQLKVFNIALAKRGPDASGTYFQNFEMGTLGLAHVRLSILDVSELGKQPMEYDNLVIVLNGEIYNFKTIKKELISMGYSFKSTSDTEVVLKSFHAWGLQCVEKFIGMFAFAIFDKKTNKIYMCRDRVGVKPLYWFIDNQKFIFGSELKIFFKTVGFAPHVNRDSLRTFMNYGYVTHPHTMLTGVMKAAVGSWTIYDLKTHLVSNHTYWSYGKLYENEKFTGSFQEAVTITEDLVKEACELRMVSDVPVGVFLSGGFDSTLVTSVLQKDRTEKLKTFTIGFSDGIDETKDAKRIANHLGTDHTSYDCRIKDAMDLLPDLPFLYDDPIADISCIPTMLVSKLARKEVKVALSADGGDELFAGYSGFSSTPKLLGNLNKIPFQNLAGNLFTILAPIFTGKHNHIHKKLTGLGSILSSPTTDRVYQKHIHQSGLPNEIIDRLFLHNARIQYSGREKIVLSDVLDELFILGVDDVLRDLLLVKVDRATMGNSLEGREPLLDNNLMAFAATLPYHYKNDGVLSKKPIREIVYKYVPKEIMDRPKIGFDLPIYKWLKSDLNFLLEDYLNEKKIVASNCFNFNYVREIISSFKEGKFRYPVVIWRLLVFQMWYEEWF